MNRRHTAGWAVLALVPATFVTLAALADQLAELAVGTGIAAFLVLCIFVGEHLLDSSDRHRN